MSELVPDSIEPIIAVRAWRVFDRAEVFANALILGARPDEIDWSAWEGDDLDLRSAFHSDTVWHGGRLEAICGSVKPHTPPDEGCTCGIYALSDVGRLIDSFGFGDGGHVLGVVALSGKVIPGSRGWRAQRAKVIGLFNDPALPVERIAAKLGVPALDQVPALTPPVVEESPDAVSVSTVTFKAAIESCIRAMNELGNRLGFMAGSRHEKEE